MNNKVYLTKVEALTGLDSRGMVCICPEGKGNNSFSLVHLDTLYLMPLAWVEEQPVYPGDELWHVSSGTYVTVDSNWIAETIYLETTDGIMVPVGSLSWVKPPEVSRSGWVNVYEVYGRNSLGVIYPSREEALKEAFEGAIDCIFIEFKVNSNLQGNK